MTDQTNDPVAAAAAQLQAQEQSKGIVGELLDDVRELGEKIENFINPGESDNSPSSTELTSAVTEDPNAGASAAGNPSVADSASSAQPVSQSVVTEARSVSASLVERARVSIDHLRAHLWTFEQSTVAHLHKDLDFIESLFK
jgi:hypothetical protein